MITLHTNKVRLALSVPIGTALAAVAASGQEPARAQASPRQAEWVEIGMATDGTRAFVDRRSIVGTAGRVTLWQRFTLGRSNPHSRSARAVEQRVTYDCRTRIVSTLESRDLSDTGAVLRRQRFRPPAQDSIGAATLPEYIFEAVC